MTAIDNAGAQNEYSFYMMYNTRALTQNGFDFEPVWSADGHSLFFTSTRDTGQYDIFRLDF